MINWDNETFVKAAKGHKTNYVSNNPQHKEQKTEKKKK